MRPFVALLLLSSISPSLAFHIRQDGASNTIWSFAHTTTKDAAWATCQVWATGWVTTYPNTPSSTSISSTSNDEYTEIVVETAGSPIIITKTVTSTSTILFTASSPIQNDSLSVLWTSLPAGGSSFPSIGGPPASMAPPESIPGGLVSLDSSSVSTTSLETLVSCPTSCQVCETDWVWSTTTRQTDRFFSLLLTPVTPTPVTAGASTVTVALNTFTTVTQLVIETSVNQLSQCAPPGQQQPPPPSPPSSPQPTTPAATTAATPLLLPIISLDGTTINPTSSVYLIGLSTLSPGGPAITVSSSVLSLDPSATQLVIVAQTPNAVASTVHLTPAALTSQPNPTPFATLALLSVGNNLPVALTPGLSALIFTPSGSIATTLLPGAAPITLPNGEIVSFAPASSCGAGPVIILSNIASQLTRITIPGAAALSTAPQAIFTSNGQVFSPSQEIQTATVTGPAALPVVIFPSSPILIAGTTLTPGSPAATIRGTPVSLASGSSFLVVGSRTIMLPRTGVFVEITSLGQGGGSTGSVATTTGPVSSVATTVGGIGSFILNGLGGTDTSDSASLRTTTIATTLTTDGKLYMSGVVVVENGTSSTAVATVANPTFTGGALDRRKATSTLSDSLSILSILGGLIGFL